MYVYEGEGKRLSAKECLMRNMESQTLYLIQWIESWVVLTSYFVRLTLLNYIYYFLISIGREILIDVYLLSEYFKQKKIQKNIE